MWALPMLFGIGVWVIRERIRTLQQDQERLNQLTGGRSFKTQIEDLDRRVGAVERRMDHGETHLSDFADDIQRLIGDVTTLKAQVVEIDRARSWLFERVTDMMNRRTRG